MKINRTFCIDTELAVLLSEEHNASGMVNSLLAAHYKPSQANMAEQVSKIAQELNDATTALHAEVKKEELRTYVFKDLPDSILADFKYFPNMTKEILLKRYVDIWQHICTLKFAEIEAAFNASRQ